VDLLPPNLRITVLWVPDPVLLKYPRRLVPIVFTPFGPRRIEALEASSNLFDTAPTLGRSSTVKLPTAFLCFPKENLMNPAVGCVERSPSSMLLTSEPVDAGEEKVSCLTDVLFVPAATKQ
jgi:hypothetical protein